jgi:type I restriction-modification system DNA methylase subunit
MLYVLKRHSELIEFVVNTMVIFSKGKMTYIFRDLIKSLYPSPLEYATIVNDVIHILYKNKEANQELLEHGLLD